MIKYALLCSNGHGFEAWFRDGAAWEAQAAAGEITCPECGDTDVCKALMAPRLSRGATEAPPPADMGKPTGDGVDLVAAAGAGANEVMTKLRSFVTENFEPVGDRFAEEARRIHYGESTARGIYGEATDEEARALAEEDIQVGRLPWPTRHDA